MSERVKERLCFEQFSPGQQLEHFRTITLHGDEFYQLVKTLGFSDQQIHTNEFYARSLGFRREILPGPIVFALVFQLTRAEISWNGINLGAAYVKHNLPVYPGDTLSAVSKVVRVGEWQGQKKETHGLVVARTDGLNQNGENVIEFERSVLVPLRATLGI